MNNYEHHLVNDEHHLVKCVWLHYIFFVLHAELEQLRKGLRETLQLALWVVQVKTERYACSIKIEFIADS